MVRYDIIAALKNAVERGYSLQLAKRSLINSGYNEHEVEEAGSFIGNGVISDVEDEIPEIEPYEPKTIKIGTSKTQPMQQPKQFQQQKIQTQKSPLKQIPLHQQMIKNRQMQQQRMPLKPLMQRQIPQKQILQKIPSNQNYNVNQLPQVHPPFQQRQQLETETEEKQRKKDIAILVILAIILFILLSLLGVAFFFREQIVNYLENLLK